MTEHSRAGSPAEDGSSGQPAEPLRVVPPAQDAATPPAAAPEPAAPEPEPARTEPEKDSGLPDWDDRPDAPWHLWLFGLLALVWYGYGAFEYVMVQIGDGARLPGVTQGQAAAMDDAALWFHAAWAVAVWGGVLAALALLLRRALAGWLFALSLLAVLAISAEAFLFSPDRGEMAPLEAGMALAVLAVAVFIFLYARAVRRALR